MTDRVRGREGGAVIALRVQEGSLLLDGVTDKTETVRGGLLVAACGPEHGYEHRLLWGMRGDPLEACRALAHFLLANPPVCDIVLGMVAIGRSGSLDGGVAKTKGDEP